MTAIAEINPAMPPSSTSQLIANPAPTTMNRAFQHVVGSDHPARRSFGVRVWIFACSGHDVEAREDPDHCEVEQESGDTVHREKLQPRALGLAGLDRTDREERCPGRTR